MADLDVDVNAPVADIWTEDDPGKVEILLRQAAEVEEMVKKGILVWMDGAAYWLDGTTFNYDEYHARSV